jgi:hypothetical protein
MKGPLLRAKIDPTSSFRDGPQDQTRNPGFDASYRPGITAGKADDQVATARTGFGSFCCLWLRNSAAISVFSTCSSRVRAFATKAASVIR